MSAVPVASPTPLSIATERHYSVAEIADLWGWSRQSITRMFIHEPGVIAWGETETMTKRGYITLRIPQSVLERVHRQLQSRKPVQSSYTAKRQRNSAA